MGTVLFSCPVVPSPYPRQPPKGTTPRLAPKSRHGRRADPRRSSHRKPVRAPTAPSGGAGAGMSAKRPNDGQEPNGIRAKSLSLAIPSESGRNPGYPRSPPKKTAGRGQTASGHGPLPRHSIQSGQKTGGSGKGRKQRRRRDGGEGGEGGRRKEEGKEKRGKEARKQESRKAGKPESGEAGKPGSREAGKPGSREAGGGIKKRRRTVGCTSACGSQRSLAYRNYLLR